jgi:outer membrane protein assembly factor BamB
MRRFLLFVLLVILTSSVFAAKVATLSEVSKPFQLIADKERIYVIEGTTIFVYSLKDYKLMTKFGKNGEGPKEFKVRPSGRVKMYPLDDKIYVNSIGKASVFTKKGKFVREMTAVTGRNFIPLGHQQFIGEGVFNEDKKAYRIIDIFDSNLKKVKTFFKQLHIMQRGKVKVYFSSLAFKTYDNKIFVTGEEGFVIRVFDNNGKKIYTINRDYKKRKITLKDKENVLGWFKGDPRYNERQYQYIKENIQFPEYFPAIDEMIVKDDKIYIRTHNTEGDNYQFVIFNADSGKYLETRRIFLIRDNPMYPYHYDIANGKAYQIVEDLEKEKWDFHISPIK